MVAVEAAAGGELGVLSGIVIAPGRVLTTCHGLAPGSALAVRKAGRPHPARLMRADPQSDLCELAVDGLVANPVPLAAAAPAPGEPLYAVAVPGGYRAEIAEGRFTGFAAHGGARYLQTTARIVPGWSGGGLFNGRGELVGVLAFFLDSPGGEFNYAVPVTVIAPAESGR